MHMRMVYIRDLISLKITKAASFADAARVMGVHVSAVWRALKRAEGKTPGLSPHGTTVGRYQLGDNVEELSSRAVTFSPQDMTYRVSVDHHPARMFKTMADAQDWLRATYSVPYDDSRISFMMVTVLGKAVTTRVRALKLIRRAATVTYTPVPPPINASLSYSISSSKALRDSKLFKVTTDGTSTVMRMGQVFTTIYDLCVKRGCESSFMDCVRPIFNITTASTKQYAIFDHTIQLLSAKRIDHTVHLPSDTVWYKVGATKLLLSPNRAKRLKAERTTECVFAGKRGASVRVGVVDSNGTVEQVLPTLCAGAKLAGVSYSIFCKKIRDAMRDGKTRCAIGHDGLIFERLTMRKSDLEFVSP